jgi:hypothetical protein
MRVNKRSNLVKGRQTDAQYQKDLDSDVKNLFFVTKGKTRFGDGDDGSAGENISGEFQDLTSHASANTEFAVAHTIGSVPVGFITLYQDKAGSLYQAPSTGTAWTSSNIYLKSDVSSLSAKIFILK